MSLYRSSLLGQPPPTTSADSLQNASSSRRAPLLATGLSAGPPIQAMPQQNRRTILGDPGPSTSEAIFSTSMGTPAVDRRFNGPSLLDRTVSLLDRSEAEKQQATSLPFMGNGHAVALLPNPNPAQDPSFGAIWTGVPNNQFPINQHDNGESSSHGKKGLLDRSRTTSPHSVRSMSPGNAFWIDDGPTKVKTLLPNPTSLGSVTPMLPGILDRVTPPAPITNGNTESWASLLDRLQTAAADQGSRIDGASGSRIQGCRSDSRANSSSRSRSSTRSRSRSRIGRRGSDDRYRSSRSPHHHERNSSLKSQEPRIRDRPKRRSRWSDRSPVPDVRDSNGCRIRSERRDSNELEKKSDGPELPKSSILDRTAEEKQLDASLAAATETNNGTSQNAANDTPGAAGKEDDPGQLQQTTEPANPSIEVATSRPDQSEAKSKEEEEEEEELRPPRIPTGYRRMCVMIPKLLPLELKLISNWRYCKFIANSPRVHLTRLPNEVVEAVQRRYAAEDEEKKKAMEGEKRQAEKKALQKSPSKKEKEESSKPLRRVRRTSSTEKEIHSSTEPQMAKRKTRPHRAPSDPESVPFLNIPGMPSMESLWSFKIKKKSPSEMPKDNTQKTESTATGSWKKPTQHPSATDQAASISANSNKRRLPEPSTSSESKSQTEYVSPLMRIEAEQAAKRARDDRQPAKRPVPRSPKAESAPRPLPLFPHVQPAAPNASDTNARNRTNLDAMSVSPALSSSSHSSHWTDTPSGKGPTPPPSTQALFPPPRRTLLGAAPLPLLPTPVQGPRTPPHPYPPESMPSGRRGGPLLGDQPPVLPNWEPDPPRVAPPPRPMPKFYEENPAMMESQPIQMDENSEIVMPDGTVFDPMIFLNRDSDYSSDSDTPLSAAITGQNGDRTKEAQAAQAATDAALATPTAPESFLQTENASMENRWFDQFGTPSESSRAEELQLPGTSGVNGTAPNTAELDSEAEMTILALRLVASLEKNTVVETLTPAPVVASTSDAIPAEEDDESYGVSHMRNIIQQFLDDPSSVLQNDKDRRKKALELLPVLDELETFARMQPSPMVAAMTVPIMQFVHEIVELSSPSVGVPAAIAENASGIISHTVVEKSSVSESRSTPI